MAIETTPSGLVIVDKRAAYRPAVPTTPNENDPATHPPATVGPPTAVPGDPNGLVLQDDGTGPPWPRSTLSASPWSGWPGEWATPNLWGRVQTLTDTAWACLDLNSSVLATMPPYLVDPSPSLPADWLNNPDPEQYPSWWAFIRQLFWDYQLGEAYVLATARYSNDYPARFHVVPPWTVDADIDAQGLRRYRIGSIDVTDDLLAVHYQITVGEAHGHGPLEAGAGRLIAATALARYAGSLASAGGIPNAVLVHPNNLTGVQARDLQTAWVEARMSSMGLPAVLSGGIDFRTLSFSPKDMALIELAQFNESRIAVLLGVPPFLQGLPSGGDSMTYSNVQQLFEYHWRAGLSTKAAAVMQALSGWLLPRGTAIELNRDEYVKPGLAERAQAYQTLYNIADPGTGERAIYIDEIREAERFTNAAPTATLTAGSVAMTDDDLRAAADERINEINVVISNMVEGRTVEVRTASTVEVRYAERVIDVVAVPYDEPTKVLYRDRMIDETITRGAFEGVQMRAHEFKVNRAHDAERPIGWVRKLKPHDERGLVAEIGPLSHTREADDALELAADGLLGASIGFAVLHPHDEEWSVDRRSRTVRKAWLDHIALTGAPAYPGAKVLAVRQADPVVPAVSTPNLDEVLAWLLAERYSSAQP